MSAAQHNAIVAFFLETKLPAAELRQAVEERFPNVPQAMIAAAAKDAADRKREEAEEYFAEAEAIRVELERRRQTR